MTASITQIRTDLWETRTDSPFPGLTTHAYLWKANGHNALFYCPATDADFPAIDALGGIDHHYLSHQDEAGPMLARIAETFGAHLHAPAAELARIGRHAHVDVPVSSRHVDANGVEVIPTPGHTPGSTSYLVDVRHSRHRRQCGTGRQPGTARDVGTGCGDLQRLRRGRGHRARNPAMG